MTKPCSPSLRQGFAQARQITRLYARTFYLASRFLPPDKREAAYAVYAVCRLSDESVDDQKDEDRSPQKKLASIQSQIDLAYGTTSLTLPLLAAFRQTISRYAIPKEYFDELIRGMEMDLSQTRYKTFDDLKLYCYRVAGVVGLIMLKIFGSENTVTQTQAIHLGMAMQLTNILRDIKEDFGRGRVYLPHDEMARFAVTETTLAQQDTNSSFICLMKFQIQRARDYYRLADEGIALIADKQCRFVVRVISTMYEAILDTIENQRYDVFARRAVVHGATKVKWIIRSAKELF